MKTKSLRLNKRLYGNSTSLTPISVCSRVPGISCIWKNLKPSMPSWSSSLKLFRREIRCGVLEAHRQTQPVRELPEIQFETGHRTSSQFHRCAERDFDSWRGPLEVSRIFELFRLKPESLEHSLAPRIALKLPVR